MLCTFSAGFKGNRFHYILVSEDFKHFLLLLKGIDFTTFAFRHIDYLPLARVVELERKTFESALGKHRPPPLAFGGDVDFASICVLEVFVYLIFPGWF